MSTQISITTPDGTARAWHFAPSAPSRTGVIIYMDIFGVRQALFDMAARISGLGHHVLVPDLFYRTGEYPFLVGTEAARFPEVMAGMRERRDRTSVSATVKDTPFFIEALTERGATGPLATVGYCLGGARALRAATDNPDRVAAAASFHGGNLAGDDEDSPHHHIEKARARIYVGSAGVDASFPPEQSARLAEALRRAQLEHQIENYATCEHGWAVIDGPKFHAEGAERHFRRLAVLLDETLAGRA